ncbi:MAG: hypothetical protein QXR14_06960 [Sulfolobales archaeon]
MADKEKLIDLVAMYLEDKIRPSDAENFGIPRTILRATLQRLYGMETNRGKLRAIITGVAPIIKEKVPIIISNDNRCNICKICGENLTMRNIFPEDHIKKHHRNLIRENLEKVVNEYRNVIKSRALPRTH